MSINDNNISPPIALPHNSKTSKKDGGGLLLGVVVVFIVVLGIGYFFGMPLLQSYGLQSSLQTDSNTLASVEQRLTGLENSVRALDERVTKLAETPVVAAMAVAPDNKPSPQTTQDIARLQIDLVALSAATTALQDAIKDNTKRASHAEETSLTHLAAAIALIELREKALSGRPYAAELSRMRDVSLPDGMFQKNLNTLEATASTGAPTENTLREELIGMEAAVTNAGLQLQAQNWWDKILLKLRGLVSIRPAHGTLNNAFTAIEFSLINGDAYQAQKAFAELPPEAQQALSDWNKKLLNRTTVVDAVHNLAESFNRLAKPAATQAAP